MKMEFTLERSIEILERTPGFLKSLLVGLSPEWTYNNEGGESWCVFDVVGHLLYLEHTSWIQRIEHIMSVNAKEPLKAVERMAPKEMINDKSISTLLTDFAEIRDQNIVRLRALNIEDGDLSRTGIHPVFGEVSLSQLISTWTVHDLSHSAQIARIMAKQYKEQVGPWIEYLRILQM